MYALNKKIHGQYIPDQTSFIDANLVQTVTNPTAVIQGIEPVIVTAASRVATSSAPLFQAVNIFQAMSDEKMALHPTETDRPFSLTANMVNTATLSNQDKKLKERNIYWQLVCLWYLYSINGHVRRRIKPYYKQLACGKKDSSAVSIDGQVAAS